MKKNIILREFNKINLEAFKTDIKDALDTFTTTGNANDSLETYNTTLCNLVDKHAPLIEREITIRPQTQWFTEEIRVEKHRLRNLERKWRQTKSEIDRQLYRQQCKNMNKLIRIAKTEYYTSKIKDCGNDQKALNKITNDLLGKQEGTTLPEHQC